MRRLTAVALVIVALAGCYAGDPNAPDIRVDMEHDDVVGVWRDRRGEDITFTADDMFTATNLPYQQFEGYTNPLLPSGFDARRDKLPATGKWEVGPPIGASTGPRHVLRLRVRSLAGAPVGVGLQMRAERAGSGPVILSFYIGDPDLNNKITYYKCDPECPAVVPARSAGTPSPGYERRPR